MISYYACASSATLRATRRVYSCSALMSLSQHPHSVVPIRPVAHTYLQQQQQLTTTTTYLIANLRPDALLPEKLWSQGGPAVGVGGTSKGIVVGIQARGLRSRGGRGEETGEESGSFAPLVRRLGLGWMRDGVGGQWRWGAGLLGDDAIEAGGEVGGLPGGLVGGTVGGVGCVIQARSSRLAGLLVGDAV